MTDAVAAVDIGGTKIAAGVVDREGVVRARDSALTPAADGPDAVLEVAAELVRQLRDGTDITAVGVGSAGVIDSARGVVRSATDALPDWAGTDVRGQLAHRLGVPVVVDNDVHAHALGEQWTGAARGRDHVLLVAVGTGIGASLVLDGAVHHGARSAAGHLGHLASPAAADRRCPCGARGHLEAVASGPALLAEYVALTGASVSGLTEVAAAARGGDTDAATVITHGAAAVGTVVGGVANLLDPDVVVVGGGVAGSGALWWDRLRSAVEAELIPAVSGVPVVAAELGGDAALVGAARLAWTLVGERDA